MKSTKVITLLLIASFAMLALFDITADAAASEQRPQRRRRPFQAEVDADGNAIASPATPRFPFLNQRRANGKVNQAAASGTGINTKSLQSDISESCKSEPGCEWSCPEDVNECICRCKFDPANIRVSRELKPSPR
ncbi:hypothetical protein DAPPUDRAFT_221468 [Daphnia pulex]|uniref:Uncharacterized protein n=1 Tax=Daphnia pulex TaxID=6669 RepID=E9FYC5_DAPPU|nr:uncharacterized protein LOC124349120 [Daphnia pulicaria]EFX87507.1 hypothetical protein DAPPUDRAFT_221468 [Daphnia pulex]|eukprot:EFX87507.1 hypothetical protein DAPPUDRAFT_221468 [Daphnia pulex]